MKIVRIIARLNVGGPARHVVWLTKELQDDEFESVLIAGRVPPGEEDMAYVAEANGVRPLFIEEMSRELSLNDIVSLFKLLRLLRREKPDIVCTHTAKAGTVGRTAAFLYKWITPSTIIGRPRKIFVTHTFHGHVFHSYYSPFKTKLFILIEKLLARFATDRIIVISAEQLKEIHVDSGIGRSDQFSVIPLGIDLDTFVNGRAKRDEIRRELGIEDGCLIVGFMGRLTEIKNISMLLRAAAKYETSAGPDMEKLHFVIAGDGHLRAELESEAEELGITNLTFLGNRKDIEVVYADVDIVALTSLNEGTPLSLVEAMASGKPAISTLVGGVIDLLGPAVEEHPDFSVHERGVGVRSEDLEGFVKGLIYLVKNERLRVELATRGQNFALSNYSKDRMVDDIRQLYRERLGGNGPRRVRF